MPVQAHHLRNVGGGIAALDETALNHPCRIVRLVQFQSRCAVAEGHANGLFVKLVVMLIVCTQKAHQIVGGILLALGPEAFTLHISAHASVEVERRLHYYEQ